MGTSVQNDTDSIDSLLIDDSLDSLDSVATSQLSPSEPESPSDLNSWSDIAGNSVEESGDAVLADTGIEAGSDGAWLGQLDSISIPPVDFTAFKTLPFDDLVSNGILFVSIIGILAVGLYAIGAAMKLACRITGGRPITLRRGIIATILLSAAYAMSANVTAFFSSTPSPLTSFALQIAVGTAVLGLLLWQNPIRAFATGLVASILQTIFLFGVFSASFIMISKFVPSAKLKQLAEHTQSFTDSLAKEVLPGDEKKTRELLSIKSLVDSPDGPASASGKPKVTPLHERGLRSNPFVE